MSQAGILNNGVYPPGTVVETLTGNTGGAVGPNGSNNINVVGDGTTIDIVGNPGTNTLTVSAIGSSGITTIDGDSGSVTGSTIDLYANTGSASCGSSVSFTAASGTEMDLVVTDASNNTIIGKGSGTSTIGFNNVGLGWGNLTQLTSSGDRNVVIGFVQDSIASGSDNILIGNGSGYSITNGDNNLAFCAGSLQSAITDSASIAIGVNTLEGQNGSTNPDNNSLALNNAIGYNCLNGLSTGYSNNGLGTASLYATNGNYNVQIGDQTDTGAGGRFVTAGSYNTMLGSFTGLKYQTGTESSNILINSGGTEVNGENNTLRIGAGTGTSNYELQATYISGIDGVALTTANIVTEVSDQLGTAVLTGGTGITIDAASTPNQIIISLTPSSSRFKNDIAPVVSSEVMKLNPVSFNYKDNCNVSAQDKNVKHYGLIAEEVNDIMPELVTRDSNGAIQGVRYMNLIPLLLKEVQNLRKEIDDLKGK